MKFSTTVAVLCALLCAEAAKLDNLPRQLDTGHNNFARANAAELFSGIGSYLPPAEDKACEDRIITEYETVRLPATTVTVTGRPPRASTVYSTEYVTQRAEAVTDYITNTVTQTVPQYNTITQTSTAVSTQVVPTTIYSTQISTSLRTVTNTQTRTMTQTVTRTNTMTLPPQTQYITDTVTLPPYTTTMTSINFSTKLEYSTIYSTNYQTSTVVSTSVSVSVRPTTVYDIQTTTYTLSATAEQRCDTVTVPAAPVTVHSPVYDTTTVTYTEPAKDCGPTPTQTGYQYTTPAVAFNFRG